MQSDSKNTRIVARTDPQIHEFIARAADHAGQTLSAFLLDAALKEAKKVIKDAEILELSMSGADQLLSALESPPKANPRLKKAALRYQENQDAISNRKD